MREFLPGRSRPLTPRCALTAILLCITAPAASGTEWATYMGFFAPASAELLVVDLDGAGGNELVVGGAVRGWGSKTLIGVVRSTPDGFRLTHIAQLASDEAIVGTVAIDPRPGAHAVLATIVRGGTHYLTTFAGPTLERTHELALTGRFHLNGAADVDADGAPELFGLRMDDGLAGIGRPEVRALSGGAVEWTELPQRTATSISAIALDADPALELVYTRRASPVTPGYVVDGASHALDWSWSGGFRTLPAVGDFDGNASTQEFAMGTSDGYVEVFSALPGYTRTATWQNGSFVEVVAAHDAEPGGSDELLMGEGSVFLRGLHAYRPDGIPVWSHALPSFGLHALASGDLDADGAAEILLAGGVHSTGPDLLRILDGQTRATRFELNDEEGPHSSMAQADFDGDGAQELALLTRDSKSPFGGPRLVVLDAATGAELRRSADGFFPGDLPSGADLHVAQMDADAALELVIGARGVYDGLVRVVDGVTLALQWEQTFSYEGDTAIELLPTAGGAREVVAMTGRRLYRLDSGGASVGATAEIAQQSGPAPLAVAQVDADPALEAITAAMGTLVIVDLQTLLVERSIALGDAALGLAVETDATSCLIVEYGRADLRRRRCDSLAIDSTRAYGESSLAMPLVDSRGGLLLSDGRRLRIQYGQWVASLGATLGTAVGDGGRAAVISSPGLHTVFVGTQLSVNRVELTDPVVHSNGFE